MEAGIKLEFDGVGYDNEENILRASKLSLEPGDLALFLGKNGIGKTTLLLSLCGAIQCLSRFKSASFSGQLSVNGNYITRESKRICSNYWGRSSVIFQYPDHNFITTSVIEEFLLSARLANLEPREAFIRISKLAHDYGINNLLHSKIDELSEGTKQLVSLVSSFIKSPDYLFFDEPTALLDCGNKQQFIETLIAYRKIKPECIAAVTTHEPEAFELASPNRFFVIDDGTINEYSTLGEAKAKFYTGSAPTVDRNNNTTGDVLLEGNLLGPYYSQPEATVFSGLNISIREGELVTVTGKNGAGKTTLFKMLSTLHRKYQGRISFRGSDYRSTLPKLPSDIAYIQQIPSLQFSEDTVEREMTSIHRAMKISFDSVQDVALRALKPFGINLESDPLTLSFGQQKIVSLLSFLVYPAVLFVDEPVICLDWNQRRSVYELIQHYLNNGSTIVVATHTPELFSRLSTQEIRL